MIVSLSEYLDLTAAAAVLLQSLGLIGPGPLCRLSFALLSHTRIFYGQLTTLLDCQSAFFLDAPPLLAFAICDNLSNLPEVCRLSQLFLAPSYRHSACFSRFTLASLSSRHLLPLLLPPGNFDSRFSRFLS